MDRKTRKPHRLAPDEVASRRLNLDPALNTWSWLLLTPRFASRRPLSWVQRTRSASVWYACMQAHASDGTRPLHQPSPCHTRPIKYRQRSSSIRNTHLKRTALIAPFNSVPRNHTPSPFSPSPTTHDPILWFGATAEKCLTFVPGQDASRSANHVAASHYTGRPWLSMGRGKTWYRLGPFHSVRATGWCEEMNHSFCLGAFCPFKSPPFSNISGHPWLLAPRDDECRLKTGNHTVPHDANSLMQRAYVLSQTLPFPTYRQLATLAEEEEALLPLFRPL